jgi:hypothetical protein
MPEINGENKWNVVLGLGIVAALVAAMYRKQSKSYPTKDSSSSDLHLSAPFSSLSKLPKNSPTRTSVLLTRFHLLQILTEIRNRSAPELVLFTQKSLRKLHRSERRSISDYEIYLKFLNQAAAIEEQLISKIKSKVLEDLHVDKSAYGKALSRYRHDEEVRHYLTFPEEPNEFLNADSLFHIERKVLSFWREHKDEQYSIARAKIEDSVWREFGIELVDIETRCENMRWMV